MLEVIIMISPFALYWYSIYSPTLQALHRWPGTAWLGCFVLPHSVITTSRVLEGLRWGVGPYLLSLGLLGCLVTAAQVYTTKLRRKGLVTSGAYRYIRHPQYLSLGIAGLGLLTYWPRMIIVVFDLVMLIAYYALARSEEQRLLKQDPTYAVYMARTAMFVPGNPGDRLIRFLLGWMNNPTLARGFTIVGFFGIGIAVSFALRSYTIVNSETVLIPGTNILAIAGLPQGKDELERLTRLALDESLLRARLASEGAGSYTAHLLPADYGMLSMFSDLEGKRPTLSAQGLLRFAKILLEFLFPFTDPHLKTHLMGNRRDQYRLVFSRVDGPGKTRLPLSQILEADAKMTAVAVADIDAGNNRITNLILDPPQRSRWGDITMPMF
jgi:protein-S-isoprenylcysteine O-methyltransferase Ste14